MTIDIFTIVLSGVLLAFAAIAPLCNGLFRRPATKKEHGSDVCRAPGKFSIIITAHDKGIELERNLPAILSQRYEPGFEVIVVDESSTDDTHDVLTQLKSKYPNLYTTFIPKSSHYLSRRKLALTLGVKAANNDWLIFTDADCCPESDGWLEAISKYCDENTDIVLGYTNYQADSGQYYRFEQMQTSCMQMRKAQRGTAYRYSGNNLVIRKSVFMSNNGFLKNLKYLRGEYDFMVNEYASTGRTAVAMDNETFVRRENPSRKTWINDHLYYMETRKHLKRSFIYRLIFCIDTLLLHVSYLSCIAFLAASLLLPNVILTAVSAFSIILTITMRILIAKKTAKVFNEHLSGFLIPFMELRIMWQNILFLARYRFSDKYDFIRK